MPRHFPLPALRLASPAAAFSGGAGVWLARVPDWLPAVLLLAWFAWQAAHWTWVFFTPQPVNPAPETAPRAAALDVQAILGAALFGQSAHTPLLSAPASGAAIELRGVFDSIGSMPAFAILLVDGAQQVVREGAQITPGVTLVAVEAKAVRIRRSGRDESVYFPDQPGRAGETTASPKTPLHISRALLENSLRDPGQWVSAGQLGMNPGGGLRMQSVRPDGLYQQLGLRNGDVLQTLNGQAISNPDQAFTLFRQALDEGNIQLGLLRGGQGQQFNYRID